MQLGRIEDKLQHRHLVPLDKRVVLVGFSSFRVWGHASHFGASSQRSFYIYSIDCGSIRYGRSGEHCIITRATAHTQVGVRSRDFQYQS